MDTTKETKQDKRIYTLSQEAPAKAVVKLGVPLIMGMMIMVLYNLVDTYFIGLMHDDYQLAAVNLAYPTMMISIAISNMVGTGAASLIARSFGAGNKEKACHTLTVGFTLTVLNSLLVTVIGIALLPQIVTGLGAKANTFEYTSQYTFIILLGSIFTMGNYTFGQLLRAEGSAKYSIIGMVLGTVVNIILDPVFIFVLGMEIRGAAIATILGNAAGMVASILLYASGKSLLKPSAKYILPTKEILREIFWVGVPATLETLLTSVAYIINNNLAVGYGELTVAAMGVAQKILSLGNYIYQGFAAGTQPLMGYNYGAKNYKRMLSILKSGVMVVSSVELCVMAIFGIFAPNLISLFTQSPDVIATGAKVLRTIMCILPFVGAISMSRTSFQAMGKPQFAFTITAVRQLFLYMPMLWLLNHLFGFNGMIWAQPVTEVIMMVVSVTLLYKVISWFERKV
ncbi:putative efflux protein, MATE family [Pseudobutyrivibrio sp. YE44]|uniref:MATE family efflux transporter n=1 Tax=Pseudobutyrivibrio sp. YE44 TaxID=1520802 RepID=UPI00088ACF62|nr:MATE family efflux transporter [Pseudobutyrivibrio sp. YE44]SDB40256.1 putative efflux protein, MATE family [Pseudobutyrivibrio sp. YE44]